MRIERRVLASALLPFLALGARAATQTPPTGPPVPVVAESTLAGVYTVPQATRGEGTYMSICVGCHAAGTYVGPTFLSKWEGRPLSDLYVVMSETMPKDDPGSLEPGEYAQVIAYLLKRNGMPEGKAELPADAAVLKRIRLEAPKTVSRPAPEGAM
jgi:mono/diheme cytochrome c family protein